MVAIAAAWQWVPQLPFSSADNFSSREDARPPRVQVITAPVKEQSNTRIFKVVGTGRALRSVSLYPAVADKVTAVYFSAGERVEKGEVLVQLDDREERLALKLAKVELKDAKNLLARYEMAVKDGAVPQSEVDSARAAVDRAQVEVEQAELALQFHRVIAPFSGIVGLPRIDPGDRVTTDTVIAGLDDRSILHLDFEIPEALVGSVAVGQSVTAQTPAYGNRAFTGEIVALESRVDAENRTILTRASFENEKDLLRPGMSFSTELEIPGSSYPSVPEMALQWGREGSFVWVIQDYTARKIPVEVTARLAGKVLVKGELKPGSTVVVEGIQRLQEGRTVTRVDVDGSVGGGAS